MWGSAALLSQINPTLFVKHLSYRLVELSDGTEQVLSVKVK